MCISVHPLPFDRAQGRSVRVPRAVKGSRLAMFTFDELCSEAMGAADYTALAEAFHTIFVNGVPMMNLVHVNQVSNKLNVILEGCCCLLMRRGVKS